MDSAELIPMLPDNSVVLFPVDRVFLDPASPRQRKKAEPDDALLDSIRDKGLINPILIREDGMLVAGERRWRAHQKLGIGSIRATIRERLSPILAYQLELLENIARKQLTWQEEAEAVGRYHAMKLIIYPAWTQRGTGTDLGYSDAQMSRLLAVADALAAGDTEVLGCPTLQGAVNLLTGRAERARVAAQSRNLSFGESIAEALPPILPANATKEDKTNALLAALDLGDSIDELTTQAAADPLALINEGKLAAAALEADRKKEIVHDLVLNADFLEWADAYTGPKFDVIHFDPPYGKGYRGSNTRKTGRASINPVYLDDPDIFFELVDGLIAFTDKLAFPAAHLLMWFDMEYYAWIVDRFAKSDWRLVQPHPLIWTKGYQGVAADTKRRPRHCYETALLFSRGDRKIVKLDKDHFDAQVDEKLHLNQKPRGMLQHFLRLVVDEHTAVLDPTCGSGSALVAAQDLGAHRVLGVELDESNAEVARFLLVRDGKVQADASETSE